MISIVIPSHNNLRHLKNAYASIRKHAPEIELVLIDDASTDGTYKWLQEQTKEDSKLIILKVDNREGHTVLYDMGIAHATREIVGIMHADMIMGPNYIKNMIKHIKPGTVVCGTRVEPPLHPEGMEKIIQNFGLDFDDLKIPGFEDFCIEKQSEFKDQTTKGMFAPWMIYKKDFVSMGGHDAIFAPFPYEDSDIFQRWMIAGYELVQSRDAFVYHLTCRGHRWTGEIQKDDDYFKKASHNAARNYLRKWGSWIQNDEYQHPIIPNRFDIGYEIKNCTLNLLYNIEPLASTIYVEDQVLIDQYVEDFQDQTRYDLRQRIKLIGSEYTNDIIVELDGSIIGQEELSFIQQSSATLSQLSESGEYEFGNMRIKVNSSEPKKYELPFLITKNIF
jgi:glycosyltransferase involved in cell wall biosynthesis